eukprot:3042100-Amphidinium_carterae.1
MKGSSTQDQRHCKNVIMEAVFERGYHQAAPSLPFHREGGTRVRCRVAMCDLTLFGGTMP